MKSLIKRLKQLIKPTLNIVVDTNLFVAAYWNKHSASAKILKDLSEGEYMLLYSNHIKKEVFFILNNINVGKKYITYVEDIFKKGQKQKPEEHVHAVKDDPQDDKYIDCAISGKAKYIVTNDKHLLKLSHYRSIKILKPSDFVKGK